MFGGDGCGGGEIDQLVGVPENPQRKDIGDDFEWFKRQQLRQLVDLDIFGHKNPGPRTSRIKQVASYKLGWPGRRGWRPTRSSWLSVWCFFGGRVEFIPAHRLRAREELDLKNESGVGRNGARIAGVAVCQVGRYG